MEQRRARLLVWILLAALVAVGGVLRGLGAGGSLWLDELHTAWTVRGDFVDVAPRAMIGNQPPLPYWLLWPYVQLFGVNEWSLRAPSLIASVLSILLLYVLVERWTKSAPAALLAAAALTVQCESLAFYASEARVYALGQFLALAHLWVFDHAQRSAGWRWRAAWIGLGWLLVYTHYTFGLLIVAELVAWLVCYLWQRGLAYRPRWIAIDAGLFALGCLPAGPHLLQIAARRQSWEFFIERPHWQDLLESVPHENALWWLIAAWLGIVAVGWWRKERPLLQAVNPQALAVVLAWLCGPLLLTWLLSRFDIARLFYPRYLVYTLPAGGALIALLAMMIPSRALRGVYMLAAVAVFATWNLWLCYASFGGLVVQRNEDWRGAVAALNQRDWRAGEPLFVAAGLIEAEGLRTSDDPALRAFCLYPLHAAYPFTAPHVREVPLPFRAPGKLKDEDAVLLRPWLMKHPSAQFVVRGGEEHARQVAADVVQSMGNTVEAHDFQSFGLVWIFAVRGVVRGAP